MSLASIKQKEIKGKKKVLPKLRTILANPYKQYSPVLSDEEVKEFKQIFQKAIISKEKTAKSFASRFGIHLGLESSLRAINSQRFSCLLVSSSLRPTHLIRLITTSASAKVPTAPIYAQSKLEELTQELFGVRAISLALPLDLGAISNDLMQWVTSRNRTPPPIKKRVPIVYKKSKKKTLLIPPIQEEKKLTVPAPAEKKDWGDDFVSFSSDKPSYKIDRVDEQVETQNLGKALSNLAMKGKSKEVDLRQNPVEKEKSPGPEPMEVVPEEDEFLPIDLQNYRPLTVHQIRPNPDKKPKKRRSKKQKQLTSKS
ncbi:uncharacterized protein LOC108088521 [Drosophila ficusphila]|uniref:uncharacterized protein LOC108088521 n=1 Tax=Drosophila ficusphila TaxID=30025 RepID=UPI001C89E0C1|nr:uncharacterized protein LOC108088521 [Drosophila ficusphila]